MGESFLSYDRSKWVSAFAHLHVTGDDTALFTSKGFPLLIYLNETPLLVCVCVNIILVWHMLCYG